jgi:hypothetical protein
MFPPINVDVEFVAVNEGISPAPLEGIPIDVFELVQLNVEPPGVLVNDVPETVAPLQTTGLNIALTVGNGFTVTVKVAVATVKIASVTVIV